MMNGHREAREPALGPRAFWLRPGVVAGIAAIALAAGWVNDARQDGLSGRDAFVATVLVLAGLAGIIGTAMPIVRVRAAAYAWTAGVLLSVGALSLASMGLPLMLAGAVAAAAMLGTVGYGAPRRTIVAAALSLLVAFAVVFTGVVLTR